MMELIDECKDTEDLNEEEREWKEQLD